MGVTGICLETEDPVSVKAGTDAYTKGSCSSMFEGVLSLFSLLYF